MTQSTIDALQATIGRLMGQLREAEEREWKLKAEIELLRAELEVAREVMW
jgi:peptidoglycan hydrolase CwlO-like protein